MDNLGEHFERKVYWLDYKNFLSEELPNKDWICLAIANKNPDIDTFEKFVRKSIDKEVVEFKGCGTFGENLHDAFDGIMVEMEVIEKHPEIDVTTTWHSDETLKDAFWQSFFATCLPDTADYKNIKIICTDLDGVDRREELKNYLEKFNKGWLPSDNDNLENEKMILKS